MRDRERGHGMQQGLGLTTDLSQLTSCGTGTIKGRGGLRFRSAAQRREHKLHGQLLGPAGSPGEGHLCLCRSTHRGEGWLGHLRGARSSECVARKLSIGGAKGGCTCSN